MPSPGFPCSPDCLVPKAETTGKSFRVRCMTSPKSRKLARGWRVKSQPGNGSRTEPPPATRHDPAWYLQISLVPSDAIGPNSGARVSTGLLLFAVVVVVARDPVYLRGRQGLGGGFPGRRFGIEWEEDKLISPKTARFSVFRSRPVMTA